MYFYRVYAWEYFTIIYFLFQRRRICHTILLAGLVPVSLLGRHLVLPWAGLWGQTVPSTVTMAVMAVTGRIGGVLVRLWAPIIIFLATSPVILFILSSATSGTVFI